MAMYNTGNPVGSTAPKDLYDNAQVLDKLVVGSDPTVTDRLGAQRYSWAGMEYDFQNAQAGRDAAFQDFLEASGYVYAGEYGAGITLTTRTQYVVRDGILYRLANTTTVPYTTTGNWALEQTNFVAFDTNNALSQDLANTADPLKGAAQVGRAVVALNGVKALQTAKQATDLTYVVSGFYENGTVGGGRFKWIPGLAKSNHNGWRIIDPSVVWAGSFSTLGAYLTATGGVGNGCFVREFDGVATPEMAGAISDWNGTTGSNVGICFDALIEDTAVKTVIGSGSPYWFGLFTASQVRFTILRNMVFDFRGSMLICQGEASVSDSSGALFSFEDCNANIGNYIFDDISYSALTIAGRGIQPVAIASRTKTVDGHTVGPMLVLRGQSLLTVGPLGSLANRSTGITFRGSCHGVDVYYGVNLANNGDHVKAKYSLGKVNRASFVYGCSDVDLEYSADYTYPASASILFSQYSTSIAANRPTERIKVVAKFGEINGPVLIASDVSAAGAGMFRDIEVDLSFSVLGTNIPSSTGVVRMGAYDGTSNLITDTTQTVTTDNIKLRLNPGPTVPLLGAPIRVYTPSPNHGRWYISDDTPYEITSMFPKNSSNVFGAPVFYKGGRIFAAVWGDLSVATAVARLPVKWLAPRKTNYEVTVHLRVSARNGVGSTTATKMSEYLVLGFIDSSGNFFLRGQTQIGTVDYTTPAATFTVAASSDLQALQVTATGYTGASADLVVSADFV